MITLIATLYRKEGTTHAEFLEHWHNHHGPLIANTPELARHIVRYEQYDRHAPGAISGSDGCDGVTVQWMHTIEEFVGFISEAKYMELVHPDEQAFLDMSRVSFLIGDTPRVVIEGAFTDD
jgi:hypothetical protein